MKGKIIAVCLIVLSFSAQFSFATEAAVVPAYAYVSMQKSSIQAYNAYINNQNRVAARKLLQSDKVFLSPKDIRVEIVKVDRNLAKVKMSRLDENAKPVTLFFWTIADQLKSFP